MKIKKILSIVLSALMLCSILTVGFSANAAVTDISDTSKKYDIFEYEVLDNGTVMITSCQEKKVINIPSTIGGRKVTVIGPWALSCYSDDPITKEITIPNTVTTISEYAFDCSPAEKISLGSGVKTIGEYAFYCCENLTSINLENVKKIGKRAFFGCSDLTTVKIPKTVNKIAPQAFADIDDLKAFTVDSNNSTYKAVNGVIYTKNGKTLVTYPSGKEAKTFAVPKSVNTITTGAFAGVENLQKVTMSNQVKEIGSYAFFLCEDLNTVKLSKKITTINKYTFAYCEDLKKINIPKGVTKIGKGAFESCEKLTEAKIPATVKTIKPFAFYMCKKLNSVKIPKGIEKIENNVFDTCKSLTSIKIPASVKTIEPYAFHNCQSLMSVTIPKTVTSIGDFAFGYKGFNNITAIEGFVIKGDVGTAAAKYADDYKITFETVA